MALTIKKVLSRKMSTFGLILTIAEASYGLASTSCATNPSEDYGDNWTQYFGLSYVTGNNFSYPFRAVANNFSGDYYYFNKTTDWDLDMNYPITSSTNYLEIDINWILAAEPHTARFHMVTYSIPVIPPKLTIQIKQGEETKIISFSVLLYKTH